MDYYGLLFLYYLKGLSGKSILRLFFNIGAGGTEQLLPENTSTPTTTPILADIQYPDGLRTDQYFTYRETPTTVSNKARIKTIKGNTLVWNQLVQNGNFADTSNWNASGVTQSASSNVMTVTGNSSSHNNTFSYQSLSLIANHKYFFTFEVNPNKADGENRVLMLYYGDWKSYYNLFAENANVWTKYRTIFTAEEGNEDHIRLIARSTEYTNKYRNIFLVDMTQMFGAGNEPTTVEEFTSFFPLPYYEYNAGTLLSFNGTGLRSKSKNLWNEEDLIWGEYTDKNFNYTPSNKVVSIKFYGEKGKYYKASFSEAVYMNRVVWNGRYFETTYSDIFTMGMPQNSDGYTGFSFYLMDGRDWDTNVKVMVEETNAETPASEYVPYYDETLSLPTLTYFPTGMKSAGSVYDELTLTKAITRIGSVDFGSLNWIYQSSSGNMYVDNVVSNRKNNLGFNAICSKYQQVNENTIEAVGHLTQDKSFAFQSTLNGRIIVRDTSYTDATTFKTAMSGVYLYYELATPTETPITTEDANEALSLLMGKSVSSSNAKQMIDIITKGE